MRSPLMWIALLLLTAGLAGCGEQPAESVADSPADTAPVVATPANDSALAHTPAAQPPAPKPDAFAEGKAVTIVVNNPPPTGAGPLVQRLKQVISPAQEVTVLPATGNRMIKIRVTPVVDLRGFANKIPFGKVEAIDERTRVITVDYEK